MHLSAKPSPKLVIPTSPLGDYQVDRPAVYAWQHAELTVTNCPFGLTIISTAYTTRGCGRGERCFPNTSPLARGEPVKIFCVSRFLGDLSEEDPPVPIPNTAVKLLSPDGTARASVWESRKSPGLIYKGP